MNSRIEEIKERLHNFKTAPREGEPKGLPWDTIQVIGVWADNAPADVEYLLSKLEAVEKALEEFTRGKYHRSIVNDTWGPMVHIEDAPWEIADKALQQIRA